MHDALFGSRVAVLCILLPSCAYDIVWEVVIFFRKLLRFYGVFLFIVLCCFYCFAVEFRGKFFFYFFVNGTRVLRGKWGWGGRGKGREGGGDSIKIAWRIILNNGKRVEMGRTKNTKQELIDKRNVIKWMLLFPLPAR